MKYRDFTKELANTLECSQATAVYIADVVGETIIKAMKNDGKLVYPKLGTFKTVNYVGTSKINGKVTEYNVTRVKLANGKYLKGKL